MLIFNSPRPSQISRQSSDSQTDIMQRLVSEVPHAGVGAVSSRRGTFDTRF
jgi:hypothetical protein